MTLNVDANNVNQAAVAANVDLTGIKAAWRKNYKTLNDPGSSITYQMKQLSTATDKILKFMDGKGYSALQSLQDSHTFEGIRLKYQMISEVARTMSQEVKTQLGIYMQLVSAKAQTAQIEITAKAQYAQGKVSSGQSMNAQDDSALLSTIESVNQTIQQSIQSMLGSLGQIQQQLESMFASIKGSG